MPDKPLRVIIAMSGGVDSSVAAALLVDQGYDVTGVMLKLWSDQSTENLCCTNDSLVIARSIAWQLGFPFHTVDEKSTFRENVVQYFIDSYKSGNTPNPCIACNRYVRWPTLLRIADKFAATHVATGHYARLKTTNSGDVQLLRGVDRDKDQSYVLHGLSQDQLNRTLFPLGTHTKTEIRRIASHYDLPVAKKPDSQDLCFVGDEGYKDFLLRNAHEVVNPGPIVNTKGETVGVHQGLAFYTIGQRKGIGITGPKPYYVLEKNPINNTLFIGTVDELGMDNLTAKDLNWISGDPPSFPFRAHIKIRHKASDVWGTVNSLNNGRVYVKFDGNIRDITPGQAAVFYQKEICLGGGIIE